MFGISGFWGSKYYWPLLTRQQPQFQISNTRPDAFGGIIESLKADLHNGLAHGLVRYLQIPTTWDTWLSLYYLRFYIGILAHYYIYIYRKIRRSYSRKNRPKKSKYDPLFINQNPRQQIPSIWLGQWAYAKSARHRYQNRIDID